MNVYAIIILSALLVDYLLNRSADFLNVRAASGDLPAEFSDVYDAEAYRKSQMYLRESTRFETRVATISLAVLLVFWFGGGFALVDRYVRSLDAGVVVRGLAFVGILVAARLLLSLPFRWYSTFVLEEKYGFNKTTVATFFKDLVKGLILAIVLGGPLLAGILFFLDTAGAAAWLYCWLAASAFMLFVQFIAPIWIMPLFNKFTPLEQGALRDAILAYTAQAGFPVKGLYVIDGSRRSSHSNAFVAGFGPNKRIGLFDTLVEQHAVEELVAVIAHEVGHWKKRHVVKTLAVGIAHAGIMFYLLSLFITQKGLFEAFGVEPSVYAGLIFFGLLYAPIEMVLSLLMQFLSRKHEWEADRFAADTYAPEPLTNALKRLSAHNLVNLTPHKIKVFLDYSHPPVLERVRHLSRLNP